MGWDPALVPDPQDPATRERSILDWAEAETPDGARLLALYRRLLAVRAELPGLWDGRLDETEVLSGTAEGGSDGSGARWITWRRPGAAVCVGFGPGPVSVPLPPGLPVRIAVTTDDACALEGAEVRLPGLAAVVLATG
jgi:maltooligosyltrehalose trehalohydrolase